MVGKWAGCGRSGLLCPLCWHRPWRCSLWSTLRCFLVATSLLVPLVLPCEVCQGSAACAMTRWHHCQGGKGMENHPKLLGMAVGLSNERRLGFSLVLWKKEPPVINEGGVAVLWGTRFLSRVVWEAASPKKQPGLCWSSWTNKVGLEGLPSISHQPLLAGAGMSCDLHHESVKLHLKQYKLLPFPILLWDAFFPGIRGNCI